LTPLVEFYSKLPKGPSTTKVSGIKGKYFDGKNASAVPLVSTIAGIFLLGYTIDYQSTWRLPD
jgi:F-type H+-transporting ATPase subunit f